MDNGIEPKTFKMIPVRILVIVQVWSWSVQKYGGKRLLGTREIIGEEDEVQPNGQVFRSVTCQSPL
jgi:hypothetical protein